MFIFITFFVSTFTEQDQKCMRVTGGDQAKCAAKMAAIKARGMRGNGIRTKAFPLCKINPRHLNKRALKTQEKRCN